MERETQAIRGAADREEPAVHEAGHAAAAERWQKSIHEAGHAVAAVLMRVPFTRVTSVASRDHYGFTELRKRREPLGDGRVRVERFLTVVFAGSVAEHRPGLAKSGKRFDGEVQTPDGGVGIVAGSDLAFALEILDCFSASDRVAAEHRMIARTTLIVETTKAAIDEVAKALMTQKALTHLEVMAIMRQTLGETRGWMRRHRALYARQLRAVAAAVAAAEAAAEAVKRDG